MNEEKKNTRVLRYRNRQIIITLLQYLSLLMFLLEL